MKIEYSAGAVVYRLKTSIEYLVIKHKNGGHWDFPKGHLEEGESNITAAKREIYEETGLKVDLMPDFSRRVQYSPKANSNKTVTFFLAKALSDDIKVQVEEVLEIKWVSYKEAISLLTYMSAMNILRDAHDFLQNSKQEIVFDITPTISERTAVYPTDVPFKRIVSSSMEKGDMLNLSSVETALHLGAHVDSRSHFMKCKNSFENDSLNFYIGKAQVLDISDESLKNGIISVEILKQYYVHAPRILLKTNSALNKEKFENSFVALSREAIEYLYFKDVVLIGVDTPSVDNEKTGFSAHRAIAKYDMRALEGLDLENVSEGVYELIALPLKIEDGDGSPVRAILRKWSE